MKNEKSFPNPFRPDKSRLIVILLLLSSSITIAQETPPTEFPIGSMISSDNVANPLVHLTYDSTGMNLISEEASDITRPYLANYNVHALNMDSSADYIYHYSTAYYSKWQAVRDTVAPYIGFKHKDSLGNLIGSPATYLGIPCWSSEGLSEPHDSLLYGPHYHQEKWYRRWLYNDPLNMAGIYDVRYIPRYRMALKITDPTIDPNEDVCRIYVMVRHAPEINGHWNGLVYYDPLKSQRTLKVSDFQTYGQFKYIYFSDTPSERWYRYPKSFQSPGEYYKLRSPGISDADTVWVDINGNNGVEFRVEWLRSDAKCTLYVDYVEVYDDFGWKYFIEDPIAAAQNIIDYADSFKTLGWSNIKYWSGTDEPYSIDRYTPIRVVDSLIKIVNPNAPMMISFNPSWSWDHKINGEDEMLQFYNRAIPKNDLLNYLPKELLKRNYFKFGNLK